MANLSAETAILALALIISCSSLNTEHTGFKTSGGTNTNAPDTGFSQSLHSATKMPEHCDSNVTRILVDTKRQKLYTLNADCDTLDIFQCSTSKYGTGNKQNSNKTPLGIHRIADKRGEGMPLGAIFKAKIYTGKEAEIVRSPVSTGKDYVTTRIMHLEGSEPGVNKGDGIDSYRRYIYIHGTPEEGLIGTPASHGCVRMKNEDVVKLYDKVSVGTVVEII